MPTRLSVQQVSSEKVQGKGSWVKFKRFTVAESEAIRKEAATHVGDDAWAQENSLRLMREHITDWNWVDDDGTPLPKPSEDATVIDRLLDVELLFITGLFEAKLDPNN